MSRLHNVNSFWSKVRGHPSKIEPLDIEVRTLSDAVRIACSSDSIGHAFRRNHELIDIKGNFRIFTFKECVYISKINTSRKAEIELVKAAEAQKRLPLLSSIGGFCLEVIVPEMFYLGGGHCALVAPDYGHTLHEEATRAISKETLFQLLNLLLEAGIEWPGCAPRNIVISKPLARSCFYLIDWENAIFFNPSHEHVINGLTLFLWALNWSQFFGRPFSLKQEIQEHLCCQISEECELDEFEEAYSDLIAGTLTTKEVREICSKATYESEAPFISPSLPVISPMEMGHLVDDLLTIELSVFYTFVTARIHRLGEAFFSRFVRACFNLLCVATADVGAADSINFNTFKLKRMLVLLLLASVGRNANTIIKIIEHIDSIDSALMAFGRYDDTCEALLSYERSKDESGWTAAITRSVMLERILWSLFSTSLDVFGVSKGPQLIFRGSLGQGIVSNKSDVDFEISSPIHPEGYRRLELFIGAVLEVFDISWEASEGRPIEADLTAACGLTRDLHEWSELRLPNSYRHDPGWIGDHFRDIGRDWWKRKSLYEREGRKRTGKYLFFEARALIARLSNKYHLGLATTDRQLKELEHYLPTMEWERLNAIVKESLEYYEKQHDYHETYDKIVTELDNVRIRLGIPGPNMPK